MIYLQSYGELRCVGSEFFNVDGAVSRAELGSKVYKSLFAGGVTTSTSRLADNLVKSLEKFCHSQPFVPRADEIHVRNCVIKITDEWINAPIGTPPQFNVEKEFSLNRFNIEYSHDVWTRGLGIRITFAVF